MNTAQLLQTVTQAQYGDGAAFYRLYQDTSKSVYFLALKILRNPDDAEDVVQEVYITVYQKIAQLREPAAFYRWLNQITANKCNNHLKKNRELLGEEQDEAERFDLLEEDTLLLPDRAFDDGETRRMILEVVEQLPVKQRICVYCYYYQQLTVAQIAESLEVNENTVKSRLSLARSRIRSELERMNHEEGIRLYGAGPALAFLFQQTVGEFALPAGVGELLWHQVSGAMLPVSAAAGGTVPAAPSAPAAGPVPPAPAAGGVCPACLSPLPPGLAVCFRCGGALARNLPGTAPAQVLQSSQLPGAALPAPGAGQVASGGLAQAGTMAQPVAAATAKAGGLKIAAAVAVVGVGTAVGGHVAGLYELPFLPVSQEPVSAQAVEPDGGDPLEEMGAYLEDEEGAADALEAMTAPEEQTLEDASEAAEAEEDSDTQGAIAWTNTALERAVRDFLGQPNGEIIPEDLAGIRHVGIYGNDYAMYDDLQLEQNADYLEYINGDETPGTLQDLSDLRHFIDMEELYVINQQVADLTPLAELKALRTLTLHDNRISDLSPLAGLTNLDSLNLLRNQVNDLSPLSGMANLRLLWIGGNQVEDISPLASLQKLEMLVAFDNQITDISAVAGMQALNDLDVSGNPVTDTSYGEGIFNFYS